MEWWNENIKIFSINHMHIFIKPGHSHDLREAAFNIPKGIQKLVNFPKFANICQRRTKILFMPLLASLF